jgi:hypothetical protein
MGGAGESAIARLRCGSVRLERCCLGHGAVVEQQRRSYPVDDKMMLLARLAGRNSFDRARYSAPSSRSAVPAILKLLF